MKTSVFSIAILATTLLACSDSTNSNSKEVSDSKDAATASPQETSSTETNSVSTEEAVTAYLHLKNALVADNGKEAAAAGTQLHEAMKKLDQATFSEDQKKGYDEVKDEIKEHAEHISTNAAKIAHQREHFDMLSQDMYDLVKSVKPNQTLYKDHCPMYNDNKGAFWLSEVKEIKNPYYGKKMLTCGSVKEEIK